MQTFDHNHEISILLHTCCAPCASISGERLMKEQGSQVALFFSNSNIYPRDEYERRLSYVYRLGNIWGVPVLADKWDHDAWREAVRGLEAEPEQGARCRACFRYSLERTYRKAVELGISSFTTSLTLSPHKDSKVIFDVGRTFPGFVEENFKKRDGFRRSIQLSNEYQLYRQHYCGCEFSHRDPRIVLDSEEARPLAR